MNENDRRGAPRSTDTPIEKAVLVGVDLPVSFEGLTGGPADTEELARLLDTAGGRVVGVLDQKLPHPSASLYIGKGKLEELQAVVLEEEADLVVFDNDLSPSQGRNLQKALGEDVRILDRTELILDIFARHARTRQASLQVELAQLQYLRAATDAACGAPGAAGRRDRHPRPRRDPAGDRPSTHRPSPRGAAA